MKQKLISATEAAQLLGLDRSRVKVLCGDKRIKGAEKVGNQWTIPYPPIVLPPKSRSTKQST